jgi:uncharacterized protein YndB with AHSA1/START domain
MVAQAKPLERETIETLHITLETHIEAPLEVAFEAVLAEIGPECSQPDGTPMPFKLEAWPGGRWYRDMGGNAGHLWGHVQVIKPPKLIELCGPLFMSYPAQNFVQYRLAPDGDGTQLTMTHRAIGLIPADTAEAVSTGWTYMLNRMKEIAEANRKIR